MDRQYPGRLSTNKNNVNKHCRLGSLESFPLSLMTEHVNANANTDNLWISIVGWLCFFGQSSTTGQTGSYFRWDVTLAQSCSVCSMRSVQQVTMTVRQRDSVCMKTHSLWMKACHLVKLRDIKSEYKLNMLFIMLWSTWCLMKTIKCEFVCMF